MKSQTAFLACAVGNGIASLLSFATLARGDWIATVAALGASMICAAGMIGTVGALRSPITIPSTLTETQRREH